MSSFSSKGKIVKLNEPGSDITHLYHTELDSTNALFAPQVTLIVSVVLFPASGSSDRCTSCLSQRKIPESQSPEVV